MKTFRIPKADTLCIGIPVMQVKDDGMESVKVSDLTSPECQLTNKYGASISPEVQTHALYDNIALVELEGLSCGTYRLTFAATVTESDLAISGECMVEIVHYTSDRNMKAGLYEEHPYYEFPLFGNPVMTVHAEAETRKAAMEALRKEFLENYPTALDEKIDVETARAKEREDSIDNVKADIVNLAVLTRCACVTSENAEACDADTCQCCVLPSLNAVYIYTLADGTVLIPHFRSVYVKGEEDFEDGYYLAFCIDHKQTQETQHGEKYLLFSLKTKALIGIYTDSSKIKAPEWLRYAFSEQTVNEARSGLMTPALYKALLELMAHDDKVGLFQSLTENGVLHDFRGKKWQLTPCEEKAETPTITVTDITETDEEKGVEGGSKAIFSIALECATAGATIFYKIEEADGTVVVGDTEYMTDTPVKFYAQKDEATTYKITAWAQVGDDASTKSDDATDGTSMADAKRLVYLTEYGEVTITNKPEYGIIPADGAPEGMEITTKPTTAQSKTEKYTYGDDVESTLNDATLTYSSDEIEVQDSSTGTVVYSTLSSEATDKEVGIVTVTATGKGGKTATCDITLIQKAAEASLSKTSVDIAAAGSGESGQTVTLQTKGLVGINSIAVDPASAAWLTAAKDDDEGGSFIVNVSANSLYESRSAAIRIVTTLGTTLTLTVNQLGKTAGYYYGISRTSDTAAPDSNEAIESPDEAYTAKGTFTSGQIIDCGTTGTRCKMAYFAIPKGKTLTIVNNDTSEDVTSATFSNTIVGAYRLYYITDSSAWTQANFKLTVN